MDALASYGSNSDSSQGINVSGKQQPTGALSGLLGNYSDKALTMQAHRKEMQMGLSSLQKRKMITLRKF